MDEIPATQEQLKCFAMQTMQNPVADTSLSAFSRWPLRHFCQRQPDVLL